MRRLSKSRARQAGSTMVMFALMLPTVIVPLVGLGIDSTMLYIVQAKLSAAADGAALGAGRLLGTQANPEEIAGEFLRANFRTQTTGFWGANNLVPTVTVTMGTTKTIRVNATVDVPLLFSRIFGRNSATVSAMAVSTRRDSRIMLVIDRSGSMNTSDGAGSTVIADVVAYAQSFVGKFTAGTDQLGLVVFDGSAVVGYPTVRPWDPTITSTSTGGPDTSFASGSSTDMPHQIQAITANSGTGMAEALSIAYIELQKAHLKELSLRGFDDRLNSIVLFTDGVPSGISLYLNNPSDNMIKTTSSCTYKNSAPTTKMQGWFAVPGPPYGGNDGVGMYLLASTDPSSTHTAAWWMSHGGSDATTPNPSTPFNGCNGLDGTDIHSSSNTDFSTIPTKDLWGNSLTGTGYTNSRIVNSAGNVSSIYNGTALNRTQKVDSYHWGLAMWNAADAAAATIRADGNQPNRGGDIQNMNIGIYAIGYMGNGGIDEGLLKRIANDKASTSYDSTKPTGLYVPASNAAALSAAFDTIAAVILRLAQ